MSELHNRRAPDPQLLEHQIYEERRLLEIEQNIKTLETKIDTLSKDVTELVSAWKAASWLVSAVKWIGGIAVAMVAIITLLKGFK